MQLFTHVTRVHLPSYTLAISNHFTAFHHQESASPKRGTYEQRACKIREETGIPLMRLDDDVHSLPPWVSRPEIGLAEAPCALAAGLEEHPGAR
jgi:hypothetical protein